MTAFAVNLEDLSLPGIIENLRQIDMVPPADRMDKPHKYPVQVPDPVLQALFMIVWLGSVNSAANAATTWQVNVTLHEARSTTNADGWLDDDIYWKVFITPRTGSGTTRRCGNEEMTTDNTPHIFPNWTCSTAVTGEADTEVERPTCRCGSRIPGLRGTMIILISIPN